MKKSFLIFAMFSLMLVLTSFTTPVGGTNTPVGQLNVGGTNTPVGQLNVGGTNTPVGQ